MWYLSTANKQININAMCTKLLKFDFGKFM